MCQKIMTEKRFCFSNVSKYKMVPLSPFICKSVTFYKLNKGTVEYYYSKINITKVNESAIISYFLFKYS